MFQPALMTKVVVLVSACEHENDIYTLKLYPTLLSYKPYFSNLFSCIIYLLSKFVN
jgi:hypothetical protein